MRQEHTEPPLSRKAACGNGPCRVLLAEDDEQMRRLLAWALDREQIQVTECRDGRQLLHYLQALPELPRSAVFDVVITDIRMPGLSGLEVLQRLGPGSKPPVVVITAFGEPSLHRRLRELGAAAVFDKPFDLQQLLETVHEILSRTGGRNVHEIP